MTNYDDIEFLKGYTITNAGVVDSTTFIFVAHWDDNAGTWQDVDTLPTARIVVHNCSKNSWGALEFADSSFDIGSSISGGIVNGYRQALVVDNRRRVVFFGFDGNNGFEGIIPAEILVPVRNMRLIGKHYYAISFERYVAVRKAPNDWRVISQAPIKQLEESRLDRYDAGFRDVGGFSESEIYSCGGQGDLWRYNGKEWQQLDPPCNWRMERLWCASDGLVYVVGFEGEVLVGRADRWTQINSEPQSFNVARIAWFKDRLYAVTHDILLVLEEDAWKAVEYDQEEIPSSFGYLDANNDILLVAGPYGATVFDGKKWENIV